METNLYDLPALANFINTYVPINFDELYRVGNAQRLVVDLANQLLSSNILKWSEFKSMSKKDTENYYNKTIGALSPIILEFASNPDLIKTAEGRSRLQSGINNLEYDKLSLYKLTADNLNIRARNIADMLAAGTYNPAWDKISIADYDTDSASGIMNELSPIQYLNAATISKQYYDNMAKGTLDPVYRGGIRYNRIGNTVGDLQLVAEAHASDMIATPQGLMYYEGFLKEGYTPAEATEKFKQMIVAANIDKTIRPIEEVDQVALANYKASLSARASGAGDTTQRLSNLTLMVHRDAANSFLRNFSGLTTDTVSKYMAGEKISPEDEAKMLQNVQPDKVRSSLEGIFHKTATKASSIRLAEKAVRSAMSQPISPEAKDIFTAQGTQSKISNGIYLANNSKNFLLASTLTQKLVGKSEAQLVAERKGYKSIEALANSTSKADLVAFKFLATRAKFELDWEDGTKFAEFIVKGEDKTTSDGQTLYHNKLVFIPVSLLKKYGYTNLLIGLLGTVVDKTEVTGTKTENFADKTDTSQDPGIFDDGSVLVSRGFTNSATTTTKTKDGYVSIDVVTPVAAEGESANTADNQYTWKTRGLGTSERAVQAGYSEEENRY